MRLAATYILAQLTAFVPVVLISAPLLYLFGAVFAIWTTVALGFLAQLLLFPEILRRFYNKFFQAERSYLYSFAAALVGYGLGGALIFGFSFAAMQFIGSVVYLVAALLSPWILGMYVTMRMMNNPEWIKL